MWVPKRPQKAQKGAGGWLTAALLAPVGVQPYWAVLDHCHIGRPGGSEVKRRYTQVPHRFASSHAFAFPQFHTSSTAVRSDHGVCWLRIGLRHGRRRRREEPGAIREGRAAKVREARGGG